MQNSSNETLFDVPVELKRIICGYVIAVTDKCQNVCFDMCPKIHKNNQSRARYLEY